ncbi:alpha-mannosidase [Oligoflexus tunisiensis]|uniref:alpha-mannosidase n=1 Tax=Oligoflexus tunisiensis TaxID=708132 RepID=UPI00159F0167|nr:alpha-mannosidase [Oligoflexus tunisiensis]
MKAHRHKAWMSLSLVLLGLGFQGTAVGMIPELQERTLDLSKEKVLYVVGYAHLDTQWQWTYKDTIDEYLRNTLEQNFQRFEKYPDYRFNFTGAARYQMFKEYYPGAYERLKDYVKQGRWFVVGSNVDENDVNLPSSESIFRHILYSNQFYKKEFGTESVDYMLPDSFGFPASLPSVLAHAGLRGFSTQKLTWGSAVGIPFNLGMWEGPDGRSIVAALNPGEYVGGIHEDLNKSPSWLQRVEENGQKYGVFADYHYYGVGDQGGAPRESDILHLIQSMGQDGPLRIVANSADQIFKDITPQQQSRLPRYKGDLLLTEHSAGTLTSKAYMKRWNRKNELLADSAEKASVTAAWLGSAQYPLEKINRSWNKVLSSQMHDMVTGTSIPQAYDYAYNNEVVALNGFASVLGNAIGAISRSLDTSADGRALVVYNPLSIARHDPVKARFNYDPAQEKAPAAIRVFDRDGREVPSQILNRTPGLIEFVFLAEVPAVGAAVYDVRPATKAFSDPESGLRITEKFLESDEYRIQLNEAGDIASVFDKAHQREMLASPARLEFLYEKPSAYPAWNMDWKDRQKPPYAYVDGPAEVRIVEKGPVRVSLEIKRRAQNSIFSQRIQLVRGSRRVEIESSIDWLTRNSSLKASFPLTVSQAKATYNMGLGTIQRGSNDPKKYEVPSHQWFDLTDTDGSYGVSILEDSKYGSDKPSDNTLRLTLLYTPNTELGGHPWNATQDWGHHEFTYALYGHAGDWREGQSMWQGAALNQPLLAFETGKHDGALGKAFSFASLNTAQVAIRAIKRAEDSGNIFIVRLQELAGLDHDGVELTFPASIVEAYEVNGQEQKIGEVSYSGHSLQLRIGRFSPRSFAVRLSDPSSSETLPQSMPVPLVFDQDVASPADQKTDGSMSDAGASYPAELFPKTLVSEDILFQLGPTGSGQANAVTARGQTIQLPPGDYDRLYVLAAADEETSATFRLQGRPVIQSIQKWFGFLGTFDRRTWIDQARVKDIQPGFIKKDPIAWFATHRHLADGRDDSWIFSYLFKYGFKLPRDTREFTLPDNPKIKIFAVTLAKNPNDATRAAQPLYDEFKGRNVLQPYSYQPLFGPPLAQASVDRKESFDQLKMGPPRNNDFADARSGNGVTVQYAGPRPHEKSGAQGQLLPRLHDGDFARSSDDTDRCVWYDGVQGRMILDLKKPVAIARINTYSYHRSDRAPQRFALFGSTKERPDFSKVTPAEWSLIAEVNSSPLGDGGIHGSSVAGSEGSLGSYRYLMWVAANVGQGTFFTEFDVDAIAN